MSIKEYPPRHIPVLLDASLELMQPKLGESYLDLTTGYGGHASAFLARTESYPDAVLVDRDTEALGRLDTLASKGVKFLQSDFAVAATKLVRDQRKFDLILVDLGVSSPQLDESERGFSFRLDGPLDMRMDQSQGRTAAELIRDSSAAELSEIIQRYGEEPRSVANRYAQAIKNASEIKTTTDLANIIAASHVGRWQKIHPATRTFQAIRIVVNDELGQIERLLPLLPKLLNFGGRVGIISFHSLEDRLVKSFLREQTKSGYEATLAVINKKPRFGTEDVSNPRARSAKLRVAAKIKK